MIIKNFQKLCLSPLRKQALMIAEAGLEAIETKKVIKGIVSFDQKKQLLIVARKKFDLANFKRIFVFGFGKAALAGVTAIESILKDKITKGYVIDLQAGKISPKIISRVGTHPTPSSENIAYAKEAVAMLEDLKETDLALCVVSGGGSSLFTWPYDLGAEGQSQIFKALTKQGASIFEINTVRKHLDKVKGGNLAKIIYPATCVSLIFSDVPGDDLGMVASGPTVKDHTTCRQAGEILKQYGVLEKLDLPGLKLYETPKEDKYFQNVHNVLAVSAKTALKAMKEKADDLGFEVKVFSENFQGEARELGPQVIARVKKHQCLLGIGESTVHIRGSGQGGRNQEMALAALPIVKEDQVFICLASDGYDNTEAAGAIVDTITNTKARALKLDFRKFLANNGSFDFFIAIDDAIMTGLTGSNVSDFFVCLKK